MGYRDDFYVAENIVGITGPVNDLPSVYFRNSAGEYGHITQVHQADFNWGRTPVATDTTWEIVNECKSECGCGKPGAHEYCVRGGKRIRFHVSRSQFRPRADLTSGELDIAAQSIYLCPYAKTDPAYDKARGSSQRAAENQRLAQTFADSHKKDALGRRGAVDFTADGTANALLKISHPARAK